jgi:hypothetical protein
LNHFDHFDSLKGLPTNFDYFYIIFAMAKVTRECKIILFLIIMLFGAGALIVGIFIAAIGISSDILSAEGNYN